MEINWKLDWIFFSFSSLLILPFWKWIRNEMKKKTKLIKNLFQQQYVLFVYVCV